MVHDAWRGRRIGSPNSAVAENDRVCPAAGRDSSLELAAPIEKSATTENCSSALAGTALRTGLRGCMTDVSQIISELRRHGLTEPIPDEHHTARRERRWREELEQIEDERTLEGASQPVRHEGLDDPLAGQVLEDADEEVEVLDEVDDETPAGRPDGFLLGVDPDADLADLPVPEGMAEEVQEEGLDALAWYRSPHWEPSERWGIYMRESALYFLAREIFPRLTFQRRGRPTTTIDRIRQAERLLFLHEWVHFVTDIGGAALELGRPSPVPLYTPYIRGIYGRPNGDAEPLEEALANAFAYDQLPGGMFRPGLRRFFRAQPAGYKAFERYRSPAAFVDGRRQLAAAIALGQRRSRAPLELLIDPAAPTLSFADVPVRILRDHANPNFGLRFVKTIPVDQQIESAQFKRDLKKLPRDVVRRYQTKTRVMMETSLRARGLNFESLTGCDTVFSVRVTRSYRITLREHMQGWELLRIGSHQNVYRNPGGC